MNTQIISKENTKLKKFLNSILKLIIICNSAQHNAVLSVYTEFKMKTKRLPKGEIEKRVIVNET